LAMNSLDWKSMQIASKLNKKNKIFSFTLNDILHENVNYTESHRRHLSLWDVENTADHTAVWLS